MIWNTFKKLFSKTLPSEDIPPVPSYYTHDLVSQEAINSESGSGESAVSQEGYTLINLAIEEDMAKKRKHRKITLPKTDTDSIAVAVTSQTTAPAISSLDIEAVENWFDIDLASVPAVQLREGAMLLDQAADGLTRQGNDVEMIRLRKRALDLLDAWQAVKRVGTASPGIQRIYAKQSREIALACDRLASAVNEQDGVQAVQFWQQGADCLERLYARFPEQPPQFEGVFKRIYRQAALACDRLASAVNEQDGAQAVQFWQQGADCLERLYARFPEQPLRFEGVFSRVHRQAALACDRLASAVNEQDGTQALQFWQQGADCLKRLYVRFPEQPAGIARLYAKIQKKLSISDN